MKLLYVVLLFFVAYQVTEGFKFNCKNSDSCGENRCCVRFQPDVPWMHKFRMCKPMAKLGQECNPDVDDNGVYYFTCPCGEGMECVEMTESSSESPSTLSSNSGSSSKSSSDSSSSSSSSSEEKYRCVAVSTSNEDQSEKPKEQEEIV